MAKKKLKKKKSYLIATQVTEVYGHQYWKVKAESPEEAIELFNKGEGEFDSEEIEVQNLGEPEVIEETEIEQ